MLKTIGWVQEIGIPLFGVCLGLQGVVEYFGGKLGQLSTPQHGKSSSIKVVGDGQLLNGLPKVFQAGRYHSLYAERETLPRVLKVVAETEENQSSGCRTCALPWAAVQFHPESIMTMHQRMGELIIANAMGFAARQTAKK